MTRWLLLLQEFDVIIIDMSRRDNVVTKFLFSLTNDGDVIDVEDNFPYECLFVLFSCMPWYVDIANYLLIEKISDHHSPKQ